MCATAAASYTGRFLHIEQDPGFRSAGDWTAAVLETWPLPPAIPAPPTGLTATPGKKKITLAWSASAGATSYGIVKRSTTSGGPYSTIAAGVTSTSYNNTGLLPTTTYYYVVSAASSAGQSASSAQVSARAK